MKDVLHCSVLASEKAHELRIGLGEAVAEATARIVSFCLAAPQQSLQRNELEELAMEDELIRK